MVEAEYGDAATTTLLTLPTTSRCKPQPVARQAGNPRRRRALAATLVAGLALAAAPPVAAHANLVATTPGEGSRLVEAPAKIGLRFDQLVTAFPTSIVVFNAGGARFSGAARGAADAHTVTARLTARARGGYTVRWQILSADGHVVAGVFTFGLGMPAPAPTAAYGAGGPTRGEDLVRWGYFLGLALLLGGLGFRLVILPRHAPAAVERRFYLMSGLGVVVILELGILAFFLRSEDVLQLPFKRFLDGDLGPIAATRYGHAFIYMTLGFSLLAALLFLAWLSERRYLLWLALLVGLLFASGLSLSGHSAVDPGSSWRTELADWLHLTTAMLWVGGLVQLALTVWPLAPELRRQALLRFSRAASVLVALVVLAGAYLAFVRFPQVADLWQTRYGAVMLVKGGLAGCALALGAYHHFRLRPRALAGDGFSARAYSLLVESGAGVLILLVTAALVNTNPPPRLARLPSAAPTTAGPVPARRP